MDSSKILKISWCLAGLLFVMAVAGTFDMCWGFYRSYFPTEFAPIFSFICSDWLIVIMGFLLLAIAFYGMTRKEGKA